MLIFLVTIAIVFLLAQTTNVIGVNKQLSVEIPVWQKMADLISNPQIDNYKIYDEMPFGQSRTAYISYESDQDVAQIRSFYVNKGFSEINEEEGLCKDDLFLSVKDNNAKTQVSIHGEFSLDSWLYCQG